MLLIWNSNLGLKWSNLRRRLRKLHLILSKMRLRVRLNKNGQRLRSSWRRLRLGVRMKACHGLSQRKLSLSLSNNLLISRQMKMRDCCHGMSLRRNLRDCIRLTLQRGTYHGVNCWLRHLNLRLLIQRQLCWCLHIRLIGIVC